MANLDKLVDLSLFPRPDPSNRLNYSWSLWFEQYAEGDANYDHLWMQKYSNIYSITIVGLYLGFIAAAKKIMEKRDAFDMKTELILWNCWNAIFSIIGAVRLAPSYCWALQHGGFQFSVCTQQFNHGISAFWCEKFAIAKVWELADTTFLIMRKRRVEFLHWYHHATVLLYTWHAHHEATAPGRIFTLMNYFVHSFMYAYFAARAAHLRLPPQVAVGVTAVQLVQMVLGLYVTLCVLLVKMMGGYCHQSYENTMFALAIYGSYFILFLRFFQKSYLCKNHGGSGTKDKLRVSYRNDDKIDNKYFRRESYRMNLE